MRGQRPYTASIGNVLIYTAAAALWTTNGATELKADANDTSPTLLVEFAPTKRDETPGPGEDTHDNWKSVSIVATLKNSTDRDIRLMRVLDEYDFILEVFDAEDRQVALTLYGIRIRNLREPRRLVSLPIGYKVLKPGEGLSANINITRQFDITLPGKYFVRARRIYTSPDGRKLPDVTSARLQFEIK